MVLNLELLVWRWPCTVADGEDLRDGLTAFAIGQGLLMGAVQANETTGLQRENRR